MFTPEYHRFFKKDIERDKKSGRCEGDDFLLLKEVLTSLIEGKELEVSNKNHSLKGEWAGCGECHLKSDWLLIYRYDIDSHTITFIRLGTHAQIFKKYK